MADAVVIRHLERLLSPRLVEDFRRGVVPDKAAATHDTLERLPEVLRQPQLASFAALSRAYRGPVAFGRGLRFPQVFDAGANAANLRQLGLTVYLRDIAPYAAGGHTFLRELETELGIAQGSARLTAFSSPHDDGVACHYDAEEVISVQMEGSKTFYVAPMAEIPQPYGSQFGPGMAASEDMYAQTREAFPDASRATFDAIRMTPGSVLFLKTRIRSVSCSGRLLCWRRCSSSCKDCCCRNRHGVRRCTVRATLTRALRRRVKPPRDCLPSCRTAWRVCARPISCPARSMNGWLRSIRHHVSGASRLRARRPSR